MNIVLTNRDKAVIEALTCRVRLLTLNQAVSAWWGNSTRAETTAQSRLKKLENAGWIMRRRVNVHPVLPLASPVATWRPGNEAPPFGAVAYQLQGRWKEPLKLTTVLIASRKAAHAYGGFGGGFKHRTQLTHDVHLAAVYLNYVLENPKAAENWDGEEIAFRENAAEKLPDAMLCDDERKPVRVIEFGGSYDKRRVEKFHLFCEEKGLPYELW